MRVLITGIGGFAGQHLARHILGAADGVELHGVVLDSPSTSLPPAAHQHLLDLRDAAATHDLITRVQPAQIYHLAGQANVAQSHADPWLTLETNIRSQLTLFEAALALRSLPRILIVSSGEIYGASDRPHVPADETAPLRPSSPYSVSKIAQDMLGLQYFLARGLPVIRVRPFNHIGPGQREGFVAPDFAMQIARIEAGLQEPQMYVGNRTPVRDFTDVRDVVRAYTLLMQRGTSGEVYNVASGKAFSIQQLLNILLSYSRTVIEVCDDPARMRPASIPVLWGDSSRLRDATGWQPVISFEDSLLDVLADCRERVQQAS